MPALAQTQPAVGLDDQHPAPRRGPPAATRRARARPGAGPCRAPRRARAPARPGARCASVARPPLGLRDHLLRDDDHVAGPGASPAARGRVGDQLAERAPRPRSPAGLDRDDLERRRSSPRATRPARARASAAAVRGARSGRRRSARRAPRGRRACRGRAPSDSSGSTATSYPARSARSRWRSALPSPNAGPIASAGASSRALVPVPWRSGITATRPPAHPAERASSSAGSSSGQSPGSSAEHSAPERQRPDDPQRRRLGVAAVVGLAQDLERGRRALRVAQREPLGAPLAGDHDHPLDRLGGARSRRARRRASP